MITPRAGVSRPDSAGVTHTLPHFERVGYSMATTARNTGTHFRYDDDDHLWHAKLRVQVIDVDGEQFLQFITKVATLVELLAWIADVFGGLANVADSTVKGVPAGTYTVALVPPD